MPEDNQNLSRHCLQTVIFRPGEGRWGLRRSGGWRSRTSVMGRRTSGLGYQLATSTSTISASEDAVMCSSVSPVMVTPSRVDTATPFTVTAPVAATR